MTSVKENKNKKPQNALALHTSFKKITVKELNQLGYLVGKQQSPIGDKPYKFVVVEMLNEDKKGEVSFCMLYSTESKSGLILPNPYRYYLSHPLI